MRPWQDMVIGVILTSLIVFAWLWIVYYAVSH